MSNQTGKGHPLRPSSVAAQVPARNQLKVRAPAATPEKPLTAEQRQIMICEAAYYLAEQRGFGVGHELDDWLVAERQIDAVISGGERPATPHS